MIFADIKEHGDPRTKPFHPFELKAADFDNSPIPIIRAASDQGHAEIATDKSFCSVCFKNLADQCRGGALSVGPGDGDQRQRQRAICKFDLADDFDAALAGLLEKHIVHRHTGARHNYVNAFEPI
jgi:hypothetical protein